MELAFPRMDPSFAHVTESTQAFTVRIVSLPAPPHCVRMRARACINQDHFSVSVQ
ncbi:hypothetical protein DPMN_131700 [Dreissena polymorpha]|uniref:Uncharacterized protein n=1 Tax=Dreissena polymorpha TaxID=45954 RepID=A0A9D4FQ78_DREPO|nr:hypothetical protein DPMN_131700 [Dreissena polymorpha]